MAKIISCFLVLQFFSVLQGQNRINFNDQDLFLSGSNLAWLNFANDIGPGNSNYEEFGEILLQIHENGGNTIRWWLHTDGSTTPEFDNNNFVIGPGIDAISDLKTYLDIAWEREIGIKLCLWSFNMLEKSRTNLIDRNLLLLTDTTYTKSYIQNALIPMVDSLKGHPAIIAWEIFNEPEGMSDEFGWSHVMHIPMSNIQRFINLTSAAIHRTDTLAKVTNGCWSIQAMTDVPTSALAKISYTNEEKDKITNDINKHYGFKLTQNEVFEHLNNISLSSNKNYYSDDALISAGKDSSGILDFYSVHYYDWAGTQFSPFHNRSEFWQLDKPIVIGEFHMKYTLGVEKGDLYNKLYQNNYAGALGWSWTDNQVTNPDDMLSGMKSLWDNYQEEVDILGIGGDWPTVSIISPLNGTEFSDTSSVNISIEANDSDGSISLIEIFVNDTLKIAELLEAPYNFTWIDVEPGIYTIYAIAKDNDGHTRKTNFIKIVYGTLPFERLEAENAVINGAGITVKNDASASSGSYVDMATQTGSVTWNFTNNSLAGNYQIKFGARLKYESPKTQYVIVNADTAAALEFVGGLNNWVEKSLFVDLLEGQNTIELSLFWGWMEIDYLSLPKEVITSLEEQYSKPDEFKLNQNYPNPFNPTTRIQYSIAKRENVKLIIYDILGRTVSELINKVQPMGNYEIEFSANDLSSGIYFYSLETESFTKRKKMILIK